MKAPPYNFSGDVVLAANCITCFFLILGTPIIGILCDKIDSERILLSLYSFFAILVYIFYYYAGYSVIHFYILSVLIGFSAGYVDAIAYVMLRAFPAPVRFT